VAAVVQPPEPVSDAYEHALAAERLRSARVLGLLRFVGITIASGLNLLLPEVMHETRALQADVRLFAYYWLAAAAVFWANRRSGRIAHLVGLDIAVVDMPFVFLLQWDVVARNPGVAAPAVWSVVFYMLLIMAAAFSLQTWRIFLAAGIGGALEVVLLSLAHVDRQFIAGTVAVIGGVAAMCAYNAWRTIHFVHTVADEHRRRERLARYFSPQLASRLDKMGDSISAGETRDVTILFSDLRDFTALSESLTGDQVVAMLNEYHGRMVETIFAAGGTLDKFMGEQVVQGPDQVEIHPPRPVLVMHHGDDVEAVSPPAQRLDHDAEAGAQIPVLHIGQPVAVLLRLPHCEDERLLARLHRHLVRTQPPRLGDRPVVEAKGPHQDDAGAEEKADPGRHEGAHAGEELAQTRLPLDGLHVDVIRALEH